MTKNTLTDQSAFQNPNLKLVIYLTFEIFKAVEILIVVLLLIGSAVSVMVTPCSPIGGYQRLGEVKMEEGCPRNVGNCL